MTKQPKQNPSINKETQGLQKPPSINIIRGLKLMLTLLGALVFIMLFVFLFNQDLVGRNLKQWAHDMAQDPAQQIKIQHLNQSVRQLESRLYALETAPKSEGPAIDPDQLRETLNTELSNINQNLDRAQNLSRHYALVVYLFQRVESHIHQGAPFKVFLDSLIQVLPGHLQNHHALETLKSLSMKGISSIKGIKRALQAPLVEPQESVSFQDRPLTYLKNLVSVRRSKKDPEVYKIMLALDQNNLDRAMDMLQASGRTYPQAEHALAQRIQARDSLHELSFAIAHYLSGQES